MRALRLRGNWQPARLTYIDLWALVSVLVVQAILRGADYATGNDNARSLGVIEKAAPLWMWSTVLFVGAGFLLVGALLRRHFLVWLGHGVLWVSYLAIFIGLALAVLHQPHYDGLRFVIAIMTTLTLHFLLWLRTGPRPLDQCDSKPVEIISGPGGH